MVVVQSLLESFSRCFNSVGTPGDNCNVGFGRRRAAAGEDGEGESSSNHVDDQGAASPTPGSSDGATPASPGAAQGAASGGGDDEVRRRAGRLELRDSEWDELFNGGTPHRGCRPQHHEVQSWGGVGNDAVVSAPQMPPRRVETTPSSSASMTPGGGKVVDVELEYAEVLARARRAAHPARHRTPTSRSRSNHRRTDSASTQLSRARVEKRKADIFRCRTPGQSGSASRNRGGSSSGPNKSHRRGNTSPSSFASRLLSGIGTNQGSGGFVHALCFANPVSSLDAEEVASSTEEIIRREATEEASDNRTLDSANCEDTIASTLYFESKYDNVMETRPPMPLYHSDQVECSEVKTDEISRIIRTNSHSTVRRLQASLQAGLVARQHSPSQNQAAPVDQRSAFRQLPGVANQDHASYGSDDGSRSSASSYYDDDKDDVILARRSTQSFRGKIRRGEEREDPVTTTTRLEKQHRSPRGIEVVSSSARIAAGQSISAFASVCDPNGDMSDDMPPAIKLVSESSHSTAPSTPTSSRSRSDNGPGVMGQHHQHIDHIHGVAI